MTWGEQVLFLFWYVILVLFHTYWTHWESLLQSHKEFPIKWNIQTVTDVIPRDINLYMPV